MSEAKFTPGPWSIRRDGGDKHLMADGQSIMCDMAYYPWVPGSPYDWELIAAAPELYASLAEMVEMIDSGYEHGFGSEWHIQAEAALAKARGEV